MDYRRQSYAGVGIISSLVIELIRASVLSSRIATEYFVLDLFGGFHEAKKSTSILVQR
jgi:hypothetical protein